MSETLERSVSPSEVEACVEADTLAAAPANTSELEAPAEPAAAAVEPAAAAVEAVESSVAVPAPAEEAKPDGKFGLYYSVAWVPVAGSWHGSRESAMYI